jgi:putative addiction module component (TIGR02574 family)
MISRVDELIAETQKLSEAERLAVAEGILEALHAPDPEVERIWAMELEARHDAYLAGRARVVEYDEVRKRLGLS